MEIEDWLLVYYIKTAIVSPTIENYSGLKIGYFGVKF